MGEIGYSQLAQYPLFAGMPTATLERLSRSAQEVAFDTGHVILAEGGHAGTLYLLRRGKVTLSTHAPGRGDLLVQTIGPGEVLGLSWLFPPFKWRFDARAIEPVAALAVDGPGVRAELDDNPALGYQLLKRIGPVILDRLQQTRVRLLDLYSNERANNGHSSN
ncbi:MAG TPA: cyclic nucleotide-binding domain-containing protein [Acidimicrobiales bacterium]|nr:cyclic nucleotide-binding domain-containing protein [Acidimicrobiales bacterium]